MDEIIGAISASGLTALHIGAEIYVPGANVKGVLSDYRAGMLYVGGSLVPVGPNTRIIL